MTEWVALSVCFFLRSDVFYAYTRITLAEVNPVFQCADREHPAQC